jgi:hypothetical protein
MLRGLYATQLAMKDVNSSSDSSAAATEEGCELINLTQRSVLHRIGDHWHGHGLDGAWQNRLAVSGCDRVQAID